MGLAFDAFGVLWGVENGADNLFRNDLGGDIHDDNPVSRVSVGRPLLTMKPTFQAEELNRFREEDAGKQWGCKCRKTDMLD